MKFFDFIYQDPDDEKLTDPKIPPPPGGGRH